MGTQAIDRETVMEGAITARKITSKIFDEDQLIDIIDKMPIAKPMAYTVYHNLVLVNNKLKDTDGDPKLIKAYDAIISLLSNMEPEERVDFNL